jgi:tetratricopeptide (TPR) repeat protein
MKKNPFLFSLFLHFFFFLALQGEEITLPFPASISVEDTAYKDGKSKASDKAIDGKEPEIVKTSTEGSSTETVIDKKNNVGNTKTGLDASLPNLADIKNKKKSKKATTDESKPPFERAGYYMNREKNEPAIEELDHSMSKGGEFSANSTLDKIRLLGYAKKKDEAKSIIDGIVDKELKYKAAFELAAGLDTVAKTKAEKEDALPFYLWIVTEVPKNHPIRPRILWSLANLHFSIKEFVPALDYLSQIILDHPNTEYIDDAVYLSGLIYETGDSLVRNVEKAQKYYTIFLKNRNNPHYKDSIYMQEVKERNDKL